MRTFATCFLLIIFASLTHAQSGIVPYHERTDFLMASPGAMKFGLYGFDNPALLRQLKQPDLLFVYSNRSKTGNDFNRFGFFFGGNNMGFGMIREKFGPFKVNDYQFSLAFGSLGFSTGFGYGWSTGDTRFFDRSNIIKFGSLARFNPYTSVGVFGSVSPSRKSQEFVFDIGIRPTGNEKLTLFADYAVARDKLVKISHWSTGAVVEAIPGIRITGRYFDTKTFTMGFEFSFGKAGVSAQRHFDKTSNTEFNTFAVRIGAYDRNILQSTVRKEKNYLSLNLFGPVKYQTFALFDKSNKFLSLLQSIDAAKSDPSIKGIAINTSGLKADREKLWELREKLKDFKSVGKHVVIFVDRANIDLYHFASIADKIVMDPIGTIILEGFLMGRTYLKGTLEKIGVGFDEWRFFQYKSAMESLSRESMSEADREQRQKLVDDFYKLVREEISASRGLSQQKFDELVNNTPIFLSQDALAEKLVDTLGRWDNVKDIIKIYEGKEKPFVSASSLEPNQIPFDNQWGERPKVALIYALGACSMDEGIKARSLIKDVEAAVKDKSVKAIVLRVDSPGGDAMASDYIAEALKKAKGKKPVIVSQGYVAASGGYWLSMYADTIVAAPNTITGSIGVIGGWMYNKGIKETLGLTTDFVKAGEHADLGYGFVLPIVSVGIPDRNLTEIERAKMEVSIKTMYDEFLKKVALGRKMEVSEIAKIAQGRVWSGYDGKEIGLVDILGGLETAIDIAKERAGLKNKEVDIVEYPKMGLFDLSAFMPKLFGISTRTQHQELVDQITLRLKHNGQPLPVMSVDDLDMTIRK